MPRIGAHAIKDRRVRQTSTALGTSDTSRLTAEGAGMAQRCDICGKGPSVGHRVSHAHNVTKRRWMANLVSLRALVAGHAKRLKVCTRCLKAGKVTKVV